VRSPLRRSRRLIPLAVATVAIGTTLIAAAGPAAAAPAPGVSTSAVGSCRVSAAHPFAVVLVHGTFENSGQWSQFQPVLEQAGFCVSAIDYNSTQDINTSARELSTFVDQVLAASGASKVDIVGHSQGGMMPRVFLKNLGGAAKTHSLVGIAPSNYGTTLQGIATLAGDGGGILAPIITALCAACQQQIQGSQFITALNRPTDTVAGVNFTVIETNKDEVVTPFQNAFLKSAGVTNLLIQDFCPADASGHIALANEDQNAWRLVLNALDPAHAPPVTCVAATNPI
jgi:triacylglycerol esterase/lipase EstA (alpha/beta hydrolase family)